MISFLRDEKKYLVYSRAIFSFSRYRRRILFLLEQKTKAAFFAKNIDGYGPPFYSDGT